MTENKESAKRLIREFENIIKQEDMVTGKLKDYLYNRESDKTSFKDLYLKMHEIQSEKRKIHKKFRDARVTIH